MKQLLNLVSVSVIAGVFLLSPAVASAQIEPQATPYTTSPGCSRFQVTRPADKVTVFNLKDLTDCIDALRRAITTPPAQDIIDKRQAPNTRPGETGRDAAIQKVAEDAEATAPGSLEEQRHFKLKKIYLAYARIRYWVDCAAREPAAGRKPGEGTPRCVPATGLTEDQRADLLRIHGEFSEELHQALKGHGLTQPFAATLVTAFAFENAGDAGDTGSSEDTGNGSEKGADTHASGAGYVVFESVHFFSRPGRRMDLNLSGSIGVRPVLTLLRPQDDPAGAFTAKYQPAFVWSMHVEPNVRVGDLTEFGVFFGGGQAILNSTQALIENGANSHIAVTAGGEAGASFLEFGARLGIFAESLDLLHLNKGLLSPMLGFSIGYRRDRRFEFVALPDGLGNAQDRYFIRLSTSAIPLTDSARPDKAFTLTFALEHEWARKDGIAEVPHGTRVMVRGDLNLFKATKND
jgi:hypothetical protein